MIDRHDRLHHPKDCLLFFGQRGQQIDNPRKWFDTALAQAHIEGVSWHALRHTFCSRLVMAGVSLDRVSELAGHKTLSQTRRYTHLALQFQREALEKLVPGQGIRGQSGSLIGALAQTFPVGQEIGSRISHIY